MLATLASLSLESEAEVFERFPGVEPSGKGTKVQPLAVFIPFGEFRVARQVIRGLHLRLRIHKTLSLLAP